MASIGLGTDTGGSIRVPAAYQGLYGIRTTHGAVPATGLLPLAPAYDAVGWLTRDAERLRAVGEALLPDQPRSDATTLVVVPELMALADPDVAAAIARWRRGHALDVREERWPLSELGDWLTAFQTHQAWQAWQRHGDWLAGRLDTLGDDVRGRFERAASITADEADAARTTAQAAGARIRELVGDRVLMLPSASSVAPLAQAGADGLQRVRDATMRLTCLAGLGGLPAVSIPLETEDHLPAGVCLLAGPGRDRDLLDLAVGRHF
jgi:Asp-tRNA(Asn)/Glu-tRNA(Gln) amidotransferase A subunit family amidase